MRQSQLFTKTRKEAPSDEVSKNAELLIRGGFVQKEMAGVYDYLPLGLRVLKKIEDIIREEINNIGGQEILMTSLQDKESWEKTGRWDDNVVDVWFKTKLKNGGELGLANTHEEAISKIASQYVRSYKDLPFYTYQFQTKFRNETRAKSGIMRTREFIMKDLYSFHTNEEDLNSFYEKAALAYQKIFERVGLGKITYKTFASGGVFSKYSHEFQTVCDAGEDVIYVDQSKNIAINKEVLVDDVLNDLSINKNDLVEKKSIEVGNIFKLGTRFSEPLDLNFTDESGNKKPVVMGSYGIGPGRVMGAIVETFSDEKGIIWPKEISPFDVHLVVVGNSDETKVFADKLYEDLKSSKVDVLYDDRDLRAGEKFADSDLIGIPLRCVVSDKTISENKVEIKHRTKDDTELVSVEDLMKNFN